MVDVLHQLCNITQPTEYDAQTQAFWAKGYTCPWDGASKQMVRGIQEKHTDITGGVI